MDWVAAYREVKSELRGAVMNCKRLDWDDHAETSTAKNSFRKNHRTEESVFNKLVEILRPVIERDKKFSRECGRICAPRHFCFQTIMEK